MKHLLLALALALLPTLASAQCNGVFPASTACGTITGGIPGAVPFNTFNAPGGSPGQVQFNNSGVFGGLTNAQLTALINTFTSTLSGAVPASGGTSTTLFLNQAGTFTAVPTPTWVLGPTFGAL